MSNNFYGAIALTGGGSGALDAIDGASLNDLDGAVVITASTNYIYTLDADSGASESSPDIIAPDNNPGDKRWILVAITATGLIINNASKLANSTVIDPDTCGGYVIAGHINDGVWNVDLAIGGGGSVNGYSWGLGVSDAFYFGFGDGTNENSMQSFMAAYTTRNIQLVPVSGKCVVGVLNMTSAFGRLDVSQPTTDFAQSVVTMRQGDISEEFIRFVGTCTHNVLTQSFVDAADVATATLKGYVKIFVDDVGNHLTDQAYYIPFYTLT